MKHTFWKFFLYPLAFVVGLAGVTVAQERWNIPAGIFNTGEVVYAVDTNNLGGTPELIVSATGLKIGATSGTELTQIRVYSQLFSPAQVAGNTCAEQGITVTGVSTGDKIIYNPSGALSPFVVSVRAEATNTVGITFCNVNAGVQTPLTHTATFVAIRS